MQEHNSVRNISADKFRINLFKKKISLWKIFSSNEIYTLWSYLRPRKFLISALILLAFLTASLEGIKSTIIVGIIKTLSSSFEESLKILNFNIFGTSFNGESFFTIEKKLDVIELTFYTLIIVSIILSVFKWASVWFAQKTRLTLLRDVRMSIMRKVFSMNLEFFSSSKSGELLFLMNAETSRFSNIIVHFSKLISGVLQTGLYLIILLYYSPQMTVVVLVFGAFYYLAHIPIDMKLKVKSWESNLSSNTISHLFHQVVYGIKMIKIGGLEKRELSAFENQHEKFENDDLNIAKLSAYSTMFQEFLFVILLVVLAVYMMMNDQIGSLLNDPSKGASIVGYLFLLLKFVQAGIGLQTSRSALISSYGPLARVIELLSQKETSTFNLNQVKSFDKIESITVDDISFKYKDEKSVLKNVSLNLKVNEMVALVGFSGSGKSTFLDILSGLREPESGKILIDSKPLSNELRTAFFSSIGYMNQEPIIFHDSLKQNVAYFCPDATHEEIEKALDFAVATDFVSKFPNGLETGLGERGQSVSGGERQRIGLARVYLQNKPILLLDEATNALDYKTEKQFYSNLEKLRPGRVVVVVAHRLSAVKNFDKIVVFNKGRIIEVGSHEELMEKKASYYSLYTTQEQEREG